MAQYAIQLGDADQLVVLSATIDPTVDGNWNSVERVTVADPIGSFWAVLVGTDIHIATAETRAVGARWAYHKLDTLTNSWTIKDEEIGTVAAASALGDAISIAVRGDGDVIVLYNRNDGVKDEVVYARREAAVWTADILVSDGGADNFSGAVIVKGPSDRMHFLFKNDTLNAAFQRTLTSANVLEAFPAAGDLSVDAIEHVFGPGINNGGNIRAPYRDGTLDIAYAEFVSADAPGAFTINPAVSDNDVDAQNGNAPMCLSLDGTDEHLLYSEDITLDLFHDTNGGVDVEELDGVTINRISCNVYDRSGIKLAFVYDDAGTTKYGEIALAAPPAPGGGAALVGVSDIAKVSDLV